MTKEQIRRKAALSWTKEDYKIMGQEAPECVYFNKTEGELLEDDSLQEWLDEEIQSLSVIREDFPQKFDEQYNYYLLDLEYLFSLGKITEEELKKLRDKGNFNFGQE